MIRTEDLYLIQCRYKVGDNWLVAGPLHNVLFKSYEAADRYLKDYPSPDYRVTDLDHHLHPREYGDPGWLAFKDGR